MGILAIRKSCDNNRGVTLIEVLIVIAIAAMLASLSAGPLLRWRANSVVEENANYLINDIERAKIEAIRQGTDIIFTFKDSGGSIATANIAQYEVRNDHTNAILWQRVFDSRIKATSADTTITFTPRGIIKGFTGSFTVSSSGRADLRRSITVSRLSLVTSSTY